ncbi:Crp/Fnr family transcriptional regulator [Sphingobacterium sp. lm-10]|uniref:Crp/Fnr family transcriptional regulator n=1 Tax=Sphingobacterium sp. lm-10 TaxID=2944904 RepID=UPI002021DC39|nr:Crp/Fnr family transcriptional regulator [Sphingobacterium sp. lm-10]MCL7987791.1 Crp/Fnr family transcriptional regulator [Sphingobacterium sp. lm-10]
MDAVKHILEKIYPLPPESIARLKEKITLINLKKGHLLMRADRLEKHLYLIKKGVVRAYADSEKGEITFWFGQEGEAILSMASYVMDIPSYENIALIEDCTLYQIAKFDLQELYKSDIHLANWGRKLAEYELIKAERRAISRELRSATDRYQTLLSEHPRLIQRIPLKFIASYLGVTQVSLSRIRKGS